MHGPGSSKKNRSQQAKEDVAFSPFVHTTDKKKGRCRHSPIASLGYHCLPMVHLQLLFFFLVGVRGGVVGKAKPPKESKKEKKKPNEKREERSKV